MIKVKGVWPCSCLVTKSCLILWYPMDCSTPDISAPRYLLEFAQTHRHWVSDAVLPWTAAHQTSLLLAISWSLLKHMDSGLVTPSHHGLQHTRHLCSSLSLGVCSDSRMLSRWHRLTMDCTLDSLSAGVCSDAQTLRPCHQLILCRPTLFLLSVFPSVRVFSNELTLRIWCLKFRTSASASIPPVNIQGWFRLGLTDLISWQTKGLSRVFFSTTIRKHQFFSSQFPPGPVLTSVRDYCGHTLSTWRTS